MSDEIVIITPELAPGAGGLADYALRVVEEWGSQVSVRFLVPENNFSDQLPAAGGKILLHYSAYGYDRLGYPRRLLRALLNWKRKGGGRLVLMLHEIWTFWPLLNKNYLIQKLHRAHLRKLISVSDAVFTSTPSQAEHLLKLVPNKAVQVLPVCSNMRPSAAPLAKENGVAVLFGLQNSRLKTLRRMQKDLLALANARVIGKVITIGQGSEGYEEERTLLSKLKLTKNFEIRGPLSEAEISKLLSSAGFALSVQDELSLYKSGTFMAYAAHALNIISPYADSFAPEPICWLTHTDDLLRGISADELTSRGLNLQQWQERTSSWPQIARQFSEALELTGVHR